MVLPSVCKEYVLKVGSYDSLKTREIEVPQPGPTEVLVKVHAVSLQYRDLSIASGQFPVARLPEQLVPCSDMAGEVVGVGSLAKEWKIGDRVSPNVCIDHCSGDTSEAIFNTALGGGTVGGVLTEYRTFPAHSLVRIPKHLSYEEASTLPCSMVTAYNALHGPSPVKAGDTVLILGTGGVSIAGLKLARAAGANVIATSSSDEKLELAQKLGAKHVINYNKNPNWGDEVCKLNDGVGVDHIIEVGGYGTLDQSMKAARVAGWIHIVGFVSDKAKDVDCVVGSIRKALILRGLLCGSVAQFKDLVRVVEANPGITKPIIDKVFPFADAVKAYQYESGKHFGKVVIKVA